MNRLIVKASKGSIRIILPYLIHTKSTQTHSSDQGPSNHPTHNHRWSTMNHTCQNFFANGTWEWQKIVYHHVHMYSRIDTPVHSIWTREAEVNGRIEISDKIQTCQGCEKKEKSPINTHPIAIQSNGSGKRVTKNERRHLEKKKKKKLKNSKIY